MSSFLTNDVTVFWSLVTVGWCIVRPAVNRHYHKSTNRRDTPA